MPAAEESERGILDRRPLIYISDEIFKTDGVVLSAIAVLLLLLLNCHSTHTRHEENETKVQPGRSHIVYKKSKSVVIVHEWPQRSRIVCNVMLLEKLLVYELKREVQPCNLPADNRHSLGNRYLPSEDEKNIYIYVRLDRNNFIFYAV